MNKIKAFFNWPKTDKNPTVFPWWRIIWNFVCFPIIATGVVIACLGVFLQQGPKNAKQVWEEWF